MNFTEMFRRLKHTVKAQALSLGGPLEQPPGNTTERINACMKNYQRAKKYYRDERRRGDIRKYMNALHDMEYWETYLKECGAMSLRMAAAPYGAAGTWNEHRWVVHRMAASEARVAMEKEVGTPLLGPYVDIPEVTR